MYIHILLHITATSAATHMKVTLHESDKVSKESDGSVLHKGASLEEVDGTDQRRLRHLLVSLAC